MIESLFYVINATFYHIKYMFDVVRFREGQDPPYNIWYENKNFSTTR